MGALQTLINYGEGNPNATVGEWKRAGDKVLGYWCSYIPPEIIYAAGALPYRVRGCGATGTDKADHDMSPVCNCSFPRAVLELAHNGTYDYLDGIIGMNGCDHSRRAFELWVERLSPPFHHFVYVPRTQKKASVQKYVDELNKFKTILDKFFGAEINSEDLHESVALYNENRGLLKKVQELFKRDNPPITGTQRHHIVNASVSIPPQELNRLLRELLEELAQMPPSADKKVRIMIAGWVGDDTLVHQAIEDSGGVVVIDNCCFGARSFMDPLQYDPDQQMESIARSYLGRMSCPRMFASFSERFGEIEQLAKEYNVDGIVHTRLQFCDLHGIENVFLNQRKGQMDIPLSSTLVLDYIGQDEGRVRTRMEAFVEQIRG
ncbi:MAG: 2-hydroxyacyl-CoA dehydratase family protein [Proteobacteria bacterium]|nr:2-hydroxyacyl-CoA dehydratase family protein [Pseudomonadota bacterium]MBU1452484.1 2-hydroxyacyl-CoA dehydratase family protein [Pseudomonadota bacterium]